MLTKKIKNSFIFKVVLLIIIFSSCNNDKNFIFDIDSKNQTIEIKSDKSSINGFKIEIPEGAIQDEISIEITENTTPPNFEEQFVKLGPSIDIKFKDKEIKFDKDVSVTLPLSQDITGIPLIGYYNEKELKWEYYAASSYTDSTITFKTNHFSTYMPTQLAANMDNIIAEIRNNQAFFSAIKKMGNKNLTVDELNEIKAIFDKVADDSYDNMEDMEIAYNECKERFTCDLFYHDLPAFVELILEILVKKGVQEILLKAVLQTPAEAAAATTKTVAGSGAINIAFVTSEIIVGAMIVDCIACFVPNSVISHKFWLNLLRYHMAERLSHEVQMRIKYPNATPEEIKLQQAYKNWLSKTISNSDKFCSWEECYEAGKKYMDGGEEPDCSYGIFEEVDFIMGNINNDNIIDAVTNATYLPCTGGNISYTMKLVFLSTESGEYEVFEDLGISEEEWGLGGFEAIENKVIIGKGSKRAHNDPMCCPSIEWDMKFIYDGKEFKRIFDTENKPDKEVDLVYRSFNDGEILSTIKLVRDKKYLNSKKQKFTLDFTEPYWFYYINDEKGRIIKDGTTKTTFPINKAVYDEKEYIEKYNTENNEIVYCFPKGYLVIINKSGGDGMSDKSFPYTAIRYDLEGNGLQMGGGK